MRKKDDFRGISSVVGTEYENWSSGDCILIMSPPETGKTTLCLETLVPFAARKGRRVLYLVNRKILKEQIEQRVKGSLDPADAACLIVDTYQALEQHLKQFYNASNNRIGEEDVDRCYYEAMRPYLNFDYIIADECHYFSADALYNTNTYLSYSWIMNCTWSVVIYMSATMDMVEKHIRADYKNRKYAHTFLSSHPILNEQISGVDIRYQYGFKDRYQSQLKKPRPWTSPNFRWNNVTGKMEGGIKAYGLVEYTAEGKGYDHLDVSVLNGNAELLDKILANADKWLIFVDSKDRGRELEREVIDAQEKMQHEDSKGKQNASISCIFVDSSYRNDEDSMQTVRMISEAEMAAQRVLITTAVLDNGINIHDIGLRNIVISADLQDSFIQMLGRKRNDGERTHLFVMAKSMKTVRSRYRNYDLLYNAAFDYQKQWERFFKSASRYPEGYTKYFWCGDTKLKYNPIHEWLRLVPEIENENDVRVFSANALILIDYEEERLAKSQQHALHGNDYNLVSTMFYDRGGFLLPNPFSFERLHVLRDLYAKLLQDNEGEEYDSVLVREQMKWIGMKEKQIDQVLKTSRKSEIERAIERVEKAFEKIADLEIQTNQDKKEYKKALGDEAYNDLKILVCADTELEHYKGLVQRKDPLGVKFVDALKQKYGIPYQQTICPGRKGCYIMKRISESETI